jgi:D-serine deaminase-like pyridoxal phosphate-dependent protein
MIRRIVALVVTLGLVLGLTPPLPAQILGTGVIPVTEIGANLYHNTVTAGQSILTAIATAETVANQILDLTPVDEVITLQGVTADLAALADMLGQVEGLSADVQSLEAQITALFDLDTAPASTSALQARLAEIRRVRSQCYTYAMKLQTLMTTAVRTIDHLTALLTSVSTFLGAKQGIQTLVQVNATMSKTPGHPGDPSCRL